MIEDIRAGEGVAEGLGASYEKVIEVINLAHKLLTSTKLPTELDIDDNIKESPEFQKLYQQIVDLRELATGLNQGDLQKFVFSKGYILANLKALQSNLRHLTWQTQKIAEGDFSQRVDFLGDFSESFNSMTIKLKNSSQQLTRLANYDVLTQIPNRLSVERFLEEAFLAAKNAGTNLSVLIFDIDHFKAINDTYGHAAGDKALVDISALLSSQFRSTDMFARYGGEEFLAVLPGMSAEMAFKSAVRSIKAVASAPFKLPAGGELRITISCGVSELRPGDTNFSDVIKRSDAALYVSKDGGRNMVSIL